MFDIGRNSRPQVISREVAAVTRRGDQDEDSTKRWVEFVRRILKNDVTYWREEYIDTNFAFVNFHVSECYSCSGFTIWVLDRFVYPERTFNQSG
jgi:hypothetical protein